MKLVTWNINSIRAREARLLAWIAAERPDVLCLQETKVEDAGFPISALEAAGYAVATFGQRSYNGVAIALYERHGFTRIGLRRHYYQPSGVDAVVMRRAAE